MKKLVFIVLIGLLPTLSLAQENEAPIDSAAVKTAVLDSLDVANLPLDSAAIAKEAKAKAMQALTDSLQQHTDLPVALDSTATERLKEEAKVHLEEELNTNIPTDSAAVVQKGKTLATETFNSETGLDINTIPTDSAAVSAEAKNMVNDELNQALGVEVDMSLLKMDSTTGKKVEEAVVARAKEELKENSTVKDITKELGEGEQFNMGEDIMDGDFETNPKAMQEQLKDKIKEKAVDHFEGKDEEVQSAIQKVSTLKSRYSKLSSLKDVTKKHPNEMKGKPFGERLVGGINFQMFSKGTFVLDINPTLGYKITGRVTAGLGYVYRFDHRQPIDGEHAVYGPRGYVEYKLSAGFFPRLETEAMRTDIPIINKTNNEITSRQWLYATHIGLKKEFRVYKKLKGTTALMINLNDAFGLSNMSVYPNPLNMRFGFEFEFMK